MVIAKNQLFSEVPDFETPEWINLYKEPEEVIRTVGPNTFIIKPKNNKIYINGFLIPTKEWQRVIDGEEVEVTDDDGKTVTIVKRNDEIFFNEKRLLRFLKEVVIQRKRFKRGRKISNESDSESESEVDPSLDSNSCEIGISTIYFYVNALVHLHNRQQYSTIPNPSPNPRGPLVKAFLKSIKKQIHKTKIERFYDRGEGTTEVFLRI